MILKDNYLSKFKIVAPITLFDEMNMMQIDWSVVAQQSCPYCLTALKYSPIRKIYYCKSHKHKKQFVISEMKFDILSK